MSVSINGAGSITGIDQGFNVTAGAVGIGTDVVGDKLVIHQGSDDDVIVRVNGADSSSEFAAMGVGSGYAAFVAGGTGTTNTDMVLMTSLSGVETEKLRIKSSGELLLGATSSTNLIRHGQAFAVATTTEFGGGSFTGFNGTTANEGPIIDLQRSRATSKSPGTVVVNNDRLGSLVFRGDDGTDFADAAYMLGEVDGTPNGGFVPGRFTFYTGTTSSTPIERMRIASDGQIFIGGSSDNSDSFSDAGTFLNLKNNTYGGRIGFSNNTATAGVALMEQFAYWGNNKISGFVATAGSDTVNKDDGDLKFYTRTSGQSAAERIHITSGGKVKMTSTTNNQRGLSVIAPKTQINFGISEDVGGFLMSENNGQFGLSGGGYWDGGNWIATNSGSAQIRHDGGGAMVFCTNTSLTSGNSFTPTERFRIGNTGNIVLGNQSGSAETSSAIKNIDSGRDYWNGTAGDYRALRYRTYYTGSDDAYGMGISASLLEFQSQSNMAFFAGSSGSGTGRRIERMRIDLNGRVTMPYQPCFWATSNTGGSNTNTGTTGIISNQFEAAYVNVGNHFNTSTGVFTCPIAGVYEFHGQGLARQQGSDNNMELTFYKNGSNTMSRAYGYTFVKGSNDHDNLHVMGYITCAANDQIDLRVHALGSGVDCYFAQGLGYFAGRLVQ